MKRLLLTLPFAALLFASCVSPENKPVKPFAFNEVQKKSRYCKGFVKWEKRDKDVINDKNAVLCIGSSSMRMWKNIKKDLAPLKIIHCGFGGSTMAEVLKFKNFFLRYQARTIVIYEGDNDMVRKNAKAEVFAAECKAFCDDVFKLRPETKIYFISTKPSIRRWRYHKKYAEANVLLKKYCKSDKRLTYIDVVTPMLGKDGTPLKDIFLKDKLHMNAKGYKIWRKAVRDAVIK